MAVFSVFNDEQWWSLLIFLLRGVLNYLPLAFFVIVLTFHTVDVLGGVLADFVKRFLFLETILLLALELAEIFSCSDLKSLDQAKTLHRFELLKYLAWIALLSDNLRHALNQLLVHFSHKALFQHLAQLELRVHHADARRVVWQLLYVVPIAPIAHVTAIVVILYFLGLIRFFMAIRDRAQAPSYAHVARCRTLVILVSLDQANLAKLHQTVVQEGLIRRLGFQIFELPDRGGCHSHVV